VEAQWDSCSGKGSSSIEEAVGTRGQLKSSREQLEQGCQGTEVMEKMRPIDQELQVLVARIVPESFPESCQVLRGKGFRQPGSESCKRSHCQELRIPTA
jgi:hypothetical protein